MIPNNEYMMRVVVVDDEELARTRLTRMLGMGGARVVGEAGDPREVEELLSATSPDAVFLDVDMPFRDGLELASRIQAPGAPQIVFVTAHAEHAVEAFELEAADYLLKPVSRARLAQCLQRLARQRGAGEEHAQHEEASPIGIPNPPDGYLTRVMVRTGARMQFLPLDEVRWLESADNYVRLHTRNGAALIRARLADLERRLDPTRFIRIHRRTIVNVDAIKEFEPWTSGELIVVLHDKTKLKLSRTHRDRLRKLTGDL